MDAAEHSETRLLHTSQAQASTSDTEQPSHHPKPRGVDSPQRVLTPNCPAAPVHGGVEGPGVLGPEPQAQYVQDGGRVDVCRLRYGISRCAGSLS